MSKYKCHEHESSILGHQPNKFNLFGLVFLNTFLAINLFNEMRNTTKLPKPHFLEAKPLLLTNNRQLSVALPISDFQNFTS